MPRFIEPLIVSCLRILAPAVAPLGLLGPQVGQVIAAPAHPAEDLIGRYCMDCHDDSVMKGGLSLEGIGAKSPVADPTLWEKILSKIDHQQMPPIGEERPSTAEYRQVVKFLKTELDRAATVAPDPGRTDTFRRLNRTEYQNAIRDLLALEIDATALLPNDEPARGFDNVTVGNLSPTLLDRYVSAAQKIARLAMGAPGKTPGGETFRVPPDLTQEGHIEGLPLGTRGGALMPYTFPQDGEYEIQVRLARDRNEQVEGLKAPHEVEVLIDGERVALATVKPPGVDKNAEGVDTHLKFRVLIKAGPHHVGVTFIKNPSVLIETERQPFIARFNMHRHPRTAPALYQTSITGPFKATGPGDTPSRRLIFGETMRGAAQINDEARAVEILAPLLRRAYRRPINDNDLRRPLQFFREGSAEGGGFEAGIESALAAVLVAPQFLIRVETDPAGSAPGTVYRISELELASRLSFFIWSSLPDDELLEAAGRGDLRRPVLLEQQVRRMLADPRARNLATNFAAQWLHLRGLESAAPDVRRFIDFDDNLRHSMRRETELFFENIMTLDRPVTELISADYTFLDERLAKHYGVPHLYGSHFRRVSFAGMAERQRGGLLRQGSILTVTSYATRTSPVIRGNWILANLVGAPAPPPPPNVPALDDGHVSAALPMRARLAAHREKPVCASCHNLMDPVGFSLENFDAVGRWRMSEERLLVDATGGLPDGSKFEGVSGLEQALLARPDLFAATLTEKFLTFALGRGVELSDAPAVRAIVRRAEADDFRFSALILGLVNSPPFQMRRTLKS